MGVFDVAIIGGGLAGLYAARRLLLTENHPPRRIAVFEKDAVLGGRAKEVRFSGSRVVTGAGIARRHKDLRLLRLMQALGLPLKAVFQVKHNLDRLSLPPLYGKESFEKIRDAYEAVADPKPAANFKDFAVSVLGVTGYTRFVLCMGYSDFERDDVSQVLYNYGAEDNYTEWPAVAVPWLALVQALRDDILKRHGTIMPGCLVESVTPSPDMQAYTLSVTGRNNNITTHTAHVVVLATDIAGIRALLPGIPLYRRIHGQAFLRLYVKFDQRSAEILTACIAEGVTIIHGPLQKILPIEKRAGVYMIAYCDNDNARAIASIMHNTAGNRRAIAALVHRALQLSAPLQLQIQSMRGFYFQNGTHYFDPVRDPAHARLPFLARAQRPLRNVFVVGEVVALRQGWVEGALESVDAIFQYK